MRFVLPFLAAMITLAGCATPPPKQDDYEPPLHPSCPATVVLQAECTAPAAKEDLAEAKDVDFFVSLALQRNPEVLAAQRAAFARAEVLPQVTALDDPMLSEAFQPFQNHSLQTAAGRGVNSLMLSQKFPWFGRLRVRGEVAEQDTQMALARLAQAQLKVIESVKLAYYELYYTQRALEITLADDKILDEILRFVDAQYKANKVPEQDLLRTRIEKRKVQDRLITFRRQLRQAQADLAREIQTSPDADLKVKPFKLEKAPTEIDQLFEAAIRCRPELQERLHAVVKERRAWEMARLKYYPDVTAGIGWQAVTDNAALSRVANGNDNVQFTVGVNIPLWREKLRAGVAEAEHRIAESSRRVESTRDDTFRQIRRLTVQATALEQQIELFRKGIIPDAESTLKLLFSRYRSAQTNVQDLLDNYSRLLTYHLQVARLEARLGQTLASLERVVGCNVEGTAEPTKAAAPGKTSN
jgi:outer membrane protein, heavy metal efflux system